MANHRFVVLTNPLPGRDADYVDWYVERHVRDMIGLEGVLDGQFFTASAADTRWRHLGLYTVAEGRVPEVLSAIETVRGTDQMVMTEAMDRTSIAFITADIVGEHNPPQEAGARIRHLVILSSLPGQQVELDAWLENQHVGDMLCVSGFLGAERLRPREIRGGDPGWTSVCVYWAQADDVADLRRGVSERAAEGGLPGCSALDRKTLYIASYTATSEYLRS